MIDLNDVLLAMSNIPVDDPIAEILGRGLQGGYKIIEYTGSLPITITANGDALLDYRIYGADGGVGEPTENLFDANGDENYGYYNGHTGAYVYSTNYKYWRIPVSPGDIIRTRGGAQGLGCAFYEGNYVMSISTFSECIVPPGVDELTNNTVASASESLIVTKNCPIPFPYKYIPYGYKLPMTVQSTNLFDKNTVIDGYEIIGADIRENSAWCVSDFIPVVSGGFYIGTNLDNAFLGYQSKTGNGTRYSGINAGVTMPNTINFVRVNCLIVKKDIASLIQLKATHPIYIGENQLGEDEYVSFSEQKIYRDVGGTLTPTEPPISLPEIPTIDGETVIDYDGDPKPSQMYVKYKGKG